MCQVEYVAECVDPPCTVFFDTWIYEGSLFEFEYQARADRALAGDESKLFPPHIDGDLVLFVEALELFPLGFGHRKCPSAIVLHTARLALVQDDLEVGQTLPWCLDKGPGADM